MTSGCHFANEHWLEGGWKVARRQLEGAGRWLEGSRNIAAGTRLEGGWQVAGRRLGGGRSQQQGLFPTRLLDKMRAQLVSCCSRGVWVSAGCPTESRVPLHILMSLRFLYIAGIPRMTHAGQIFEKKMGGWPEMIHTSKFGFKFFSRWRSDFVDEIILTLPNLS